MALPASAQDPSLAHRLIHNRVIDAMGAALPLGGLVAGAACGGDAPKPAVQEWVVAADCVAPEAELTVKRIDAPRVIGTSTIELICSGEGEAAIPQDVRIVTGPRTRTIEPESTSRTVTISTWYEKGVEEALEAADKAPVDPTSGRPDEELEETDLYDTSEGYYREAGPDDLGEDAEEEYHGAEISFGHGIVTEYQIGEDTPKTVNEAPEN